MTILYNDITKTEHQLNILLIANRIQPTESRNTQINDLQDKLETLYEDIQVEKEFDYKSIYAS